MNKYEGILGKDTSRYGICVYKDIECDEHLDRVNEDIHKWIQEDTISIGCYINFIVSRLNDLIDMCTKASEERGIKDTRSSDDLINLANKVKELNLILKS